MIHNSDGSHYEKRGKGEPVRIDNEIPFEIPESWEWARLGSIVALLSGRDFEAKDYNSAQKGIPYFTGASNIDSGSLIVNRWTEKPRCIVKPGNLLVVCKGAGVGKMALVPSDIKQAHIARQIMAIDCMGYCAERYLGFFIEVQLKLVREQMQGVIPGISRDVLLSMLVPVPPFGEQLRIIAKLDEISLLVSGYGTLENARERLDTELPDRLRKSILQIAVQGKLVEQDPADEPASVLLDRIRAERTALVKAKKLKAPKGGESVIYRVSDGGYYEKRGKGDPQPIEVPFDVPDTWEWVRLKTLGEIVGGGTPKTHDASLWATPDEGVPWITPADMKNVHGRRVSHGERYLSEKGLANSSAQLMPAGTVVMSSRAPIGYLAIAECPIATNQGFKSVVPTLVGTNVWIMLSLDALMDDIKKRASGTTFKEISGSEFGETLIPLPPIPEQARIIDCSKRLIGAMG